MSFLKPTSSFLSQKEKDLVNDELAKPRSPSFLQRNDGSAPHTPREPNTPRNGLTPRDGVLSPRGADGTKPRSGTTFVESAAEMAEGTRARVASVMNDLGNVFQKKGNLLHVSRAKSGGMVNSQHKEDPRTGLAVIYVPASMLPPKCTLDGGLVHFYDRIKKINRKGVEQDRILCISSTMVHTVDPKTGVIVRCFPVIEVQEVLFDPTCGIVGLVVPSEYDEAFRTLKHKEIIEILTTISSKLSAVPLQAIKTNLASMEDLHNKLKTEKTKDFVQRYDPVPTIEDIDDWLDTAKRLAMKAVTIEGLQAEITDLKKKITELETNLTQTKFAVNKGDTFHSEVSEFARQLESIAWDLDGFAPLLSAVENNLSNPVVAGILSTLNKKLTAIRARALDDCSSELRKSLKWSYDQTVLSVCKQNIDIRDALRKAATYASDAKKAIADKDAELAAAAKTNDEMKSRLESSEKDVYRLQRAFEEEKTLHATERQKSSDLQQRLDKMRAAMEGSALEERSVLTDKVEGLGAHLAAAKNEITQLKVQYAELQALYDELNSREALRVPSALEIRCRTLESDNTIKTSDLLVLKEQYRLLEKQLDDCYDELTSRGMGIKPQTCNNITRRGRSTEARQNISLQLGDGSPRNKKINSFVRCVKDIYAKYNPSKVDRAAAVVAQWDGKEEMLLEALASKYKIPRDELAKLCHHSPKRHTVAKDPWNLRVGKELPATNHLVNYGANLTLARGNRVTVHFDGRSVVKEGVFLEMDQFGFCHVMLPGGTEVAVPSTAMSVSPLL
jgi:hypothetical protein